MGGAEASAKSRHSDDEPLQKLSPCDGCDWAFPQQAAKESCNVGGDFASQADRLKGNPMQRPIRRGVLVLAAVAVFVVPIAVSAAGGFTDVSDDNIFKNDIQWMADNGITRGCNPPTNDKFCPSSVVTRETMSAFMHRLGVNKVVDAKTAITADNADKLDGLDSSAFQSRAGATIINPVSVGATGVPIATISGFSAPVSGGVLVGSGNATFLGDTGPDVGLLWVVIDGTCTGAVPQSAGWWQTFFAQLSETSSASATKAAAAGNHRIDLCAVGFDDLTDVLSGSLNVQWVEKAQGGTTASADDGADLRSRLAEVHAQFATE
jgi:hypothetical protein